MMLTNSIILLLSVLLLACSGLVTAQAAKDVDVVVVGGGLSGLAAAKALTQANKSVAVLEARDRVGGRVENQALENGGVTELGAAFVGPTQDRVLALLDEYGLETFHEYNSGNSLAVVGGQSLPIPANGGNLLANVDPLSAIGLGVLQSMADTIDTNEPWKHPSAADWDSTTLESWLDLFVTNVTVRGLLETAVGSVWSASPSELSLLYVLSYIAAAGNETEPGSLVRLLGVPNGAQESRVVGGTGLLAPAIADDIGWDKISLNAPVNSITLQPSNRYLIATQNGTVTAKDVIVAMSPPLAARIRYEPPVTALRDQLSQRMFMGSLGKATAIYDTPFWRDSDLSGQAVSTEGYVRVTFDVSPSDGSYGAILGFLDGESMRELDTVSDSEIIERVGKEYVNYFGPQAANATEWVIKRWDNDVYSRGAPTGLAGPGTLSNFGPALREKCGGIHWAGTETSPYWTGYMDGAIRGGERAAKEILGQA